MYVLDETSLRRVFTERYYSIPRTNFDFPVVFIDNIPQSTKQNIPFPWVRHEAPVSPLGLPCHTMLTRFLTPPPPLSGLVAMADGHADKGLHAYVTTLLGVAAIIDATQEP